VSEDAARQLAERRLRQFERALHAAAGTMGEPDPQALVRSALDLAAHAALAVAFDPGLLHLLRINFFFERERVPHWVEARLLLSTLCRDAEGNGLYMMDAPVRELLLMRLVAHHGPDRLRAVATLLWQYAERRTAWFERSELRHAQQLTALNFLAPERAQAWLDAAEHGSGPASLSKNWFVAMRGAMPAMPPVPQGGNPVAVCKALRELDFVAQRAAHRDALRQPDGHELLLIRGPRDHGHRWVLLRLLGHFERAPGLLWLAVDPVAPGSLRASLALALGLEAQAPWPRIRERAASLARSRPLAIAIDGVVRLNEAQRTELRDLQAAELPASLYLLDRAEGSEAVIGEGALVGVMLLTGSSGLLPALGRIAQEDLRYWIDRHGGEAGLDGLGPEETRDAAGLADEILKATGGVPERVLEHLCVRCGVRWPEVLAVAEAPFALALPPADDAIAEPDEQQRTGATFLPLMPLRGTVIFPGRRASLTLTRTESMMGLFKVQNGGDNTVFAVLDESAGERFDPRRLRGIGTIAAVSGHRARDEGVEVTLWGMGRAVGTPMQDSAEGGAVLARMDPLPEATDRSTPPEARQAVADALRALVRLGGVGGKTVDLMLEAPLVAACYQLAEMLSLAPPDRQKLLEADEAFPMLQQLRAAVIARIEDGLPKDFGEDGWGFERLGELLRAAFDIAQLGELFETRISTTADRPDVFTALARSTAASGRLRRIMAHALARRPEDDALWEHVEAMTQQPEHPQAAPKPAARPPRATALKLWPSGSTLRIAFLGGDAKLRQRVMRCAAQWFEFANLHYEVLPRGSKETADIRIAFQRNEGSWSYVGTDARTIPAKEPTMNFGWLDHNTSETELQRVVLKEFGHALGLWQEHKNPTGGIEWDREAVLKHFGGPPNGWSKETIDHNILRPNPPSRPPYRPFDAQSVMLHDFPAELVRSRQPVQGGSTLSASDKAFIAALYPPRMAVVRPARKAPARKKR
jgi:hypothetical protein